MAERGKDFANIAYTILVAEKRHSVEGIAKKLGMSYASLHARLINRTCFSADEIRALIAAAPHTRFVAYLLEGSDYIAADRTKVDPLPVAIHRGAARVVIEAADVLETVDEALADGWIDHREGLKILRDIEVAEQALATLRLSVRSLGHHNGSAPPKPPV